MVKQARNRQRGKDAEKRIAQLLGGKRIGIMGGEDIFHPLYSIEVKSRKSFIGRTWMQQAQRNNKDSKISLVVVHKTNTPHYEDLVILSLEDFKKVQGGENNGL